MTMLRSERGSACNVEWDSRFGIGAGAGHSCPSSKGKLHRAAEPLIARAAES